MLTLRAGRQPQRRTGNPGRSVRRASENATKVPLSKKCKLDIKRKHLRAAIPGCLAVNSYAVNLQLQIDGEKLPDLYKCTIKKHVNNKTSCVSYRLQGTGIYNHLRGLYMRGFSCGEEPGVVVLVASRQAAPDLSYSGQSDGEDADYGAGVDVVKAEDTDSEQAKRQTRQRRQQRPRRQRKRKRDDSDEEDEDDGRYEEPDDDEDVVAPGAMAGPSGRELGLFLSHRQVQETCFASQHLHPLQLQQYQQPHHHPMHQALLEQQQPPLLRMQLHPDHHNHLYQQQHHHQQQQDRHQRLRSHPVEGSQLSPLGDEEAAIHVGLHAHALSGAGDSAGLLCHETADDDGVSGLDVAGVAEDVAAAVAEVEHRAAQDCSGPGPGSSVLPVVDPFDHLAMGLAGGLGGMGVLGDGSSILGVGAPGPTGLLGLCPDAGGSSASGVAHLHESTCGGSDAAIVGGGSCGQHVGGSLSSEFPLQRDPLLDMSLSLSPFSPRLIQELSGRPHGSRGGCNQAGPQTANPWGPLQPLDFDMNFNTWPRQQLGWNDVGLL